MSNDICAIRALQSSLRGTNCIVQVLFSAPPIERVYGFCRYVIPNVESVNRQWTNICRRRQSSGILQIDIYLTTRFFFGWRKTLRWKSAVYLAPRECDCTTRQKCRETVMRPGKCHLQLLNSWTRLYPLRHTRREAIVAWFAPWSSRFALAGVRRLEIVRVRGLRSLRCRQFAQGRIQAIDGE